MARNSVMQRSTSPESLEAFHSGDKAKHRAIVLAYVRQCRTHGATADETSKALGMLHNSVAPRITQLTEDGLIVKIFDAEGNRVRRQTRQGCSAGVYVAREFAPTKSQTQAQLFADDAPLRHRDEN